MKKVLLCLLLLALPASAGEIQVAGDKQVKENSFAELWIEGNTNVAWLVYPPPVKIVNRSGYLYFSGVPGTTYVVMVTSVDFDRKKIDNGTATVSFGNPGPGPPPGPVPPPTPPVEDQLVKDLRAAALVDPDKALIGTLATFYSDAQRLVDDARTVTWVGLFADMSGMAAEAGIAGKLPAVQGVIQIELKAKLPSKGVQQDSPVDKTLAKAAFKRVAEALNKVK
jgi:hypothetical protein